MAATSTYRAIILAAGRGSRLGALTSRRPKCLLPLADETVLARQLRLLREVGVHDVVLVVGHLAANIAASVQGQEGIALVSNLQHEGNNSLSSLAAAKDHLAGDVLVLNCDLAYERQMLESLLSAECDASLVVSKTLAQAPDVRVQIRDRRLVDIGKHIPADESDAVFCHAGLVREAELVQFSCALDQTAASGMRTGWSRVLRRMAAEGVAVGAVDYDGPWWNINSVRDYAAAQQWARTKTDSRTRL